MLDGEVPGLSIWCAVIAIDRIGVADVIRCCGYEPAGQRQNIGRAGVNAARDGERRLLGQLLRKRIIGLSVVVDSVTGANDRGTLDLRHFPRKAEAGCEIVQIGVDQTARKHSRIRTGRTGCYDCYRGVAGSNIEVRNMTVFFAKWREIFIPQAE